MTEQRETERDAARVGRRGLIAGAAALATALLMKETAQPAAAVGPYTGGTGGTALIIGANPNAGGTANTSDEPTFLLRDSGTTLGTNLLGTYTGAGLLALGQDNGDGIVGIAGDFDANGVTGNTDTGYGVYGVADAGDAVHGDSGTGVGVYGSSDSGPGVYATSDTYLSLLVEGGASYPTAEIVSFGPAPSLLAISPFSIGAFAAGAAGGIVGTNQFAFIARAGANKPNILTPPAGPGVSGYSSNDQAGVYGTSVGGSGIMGGTESAVLGTAGVFGYSTVTNGTAVLGQVYGTPTGAAAVAGSAPAGNFAGFFTGDVVVTGSLISGGAMRNAITHTDGSSRTIYAEEAPDAWLTDYGQAKLVGGKADVKLDPDFAAIVKTDTYLVLLTPEGDSSGLYVTNKTPQGFSVRESKGGASSLVFTYRIAVKRSDIQATRLAKTTATQRAALLTAPTLPPKRTAPTAVSLAPRTHTVRAKRRKP